MSQATLAKVLKGLYAGALAFAGSLAAVLVGNEAISGVTAGQWVVICAAALAAFGGVFGLADWGGPRVGSEPPPTTPPAGASKNP